MKRVFVLLFCWVLVLSFSSCGPAEPSAQTGTGTEKETEVFSGTDTEEVSGSADSSDGKDEITGYDESMEHQILVCDIMNHSIVQLDLNACNGDFINIRDASCVVWEWDADEDETCTKKPGAGIDDAKIRYSPYYKKDVVIATSSGGKAYVIDYEAKTTLWETSLSNCPHSIEMLPNGDVVVAGSGGSNWETGGSLVYFPLSTGETGKSSELSVPSCHGVQWDPEQELLWVLGYYGVQAVQAKDGMLTAIGGTEVEFDDDIGGHDLSPVYGQPGKYWVTAHKYLWLFDSEEMTLVNKYTNSNRLSEQDLKGIASFPDGTMVQCVANVGTDLYATWSTKALRIVTLELSQGKVKKVQVKDTSIHFADREFYKVRTFSKDYR